MPLDIRGLIAQSEGRNYELHEQHVNPQYVKVLRTIGFDRCYVKATGPYLWDIEGTKYLDMNSGFGMFAVGRNHPEVRRALTEFMALDYPSLVQLDAPLLPGLLAQELKKRVGRDLERVHFTSAGAETVEAAIKFARCATRKPAVVYCEKAFHGLTTGALSITGDDTFRAGFAPFLSECRAIPFNDLAALEKALAAGDVAAFIVEPIQGKGVNMPTDEFLPGAAALCKKYGTLFVADEIQTGMGRTGRFLAVEHWNVEPDMVLLSKSLSGGHVPVGALLTRKNIFDKIFNQMDRAVVHGSTFSKNDLAMAAGIATLDVMESEKLIEVAAKRGAELRLALTRMVPGYELMKEVRGKGLMIGVEFGPPKSLRLRASWNVLEAANKGLFCQLITVPLFKDHKILTQVAGHGSHTIKLLPPLTITQEDCDWIERAFDDVIAGSHKVPGAIWSLGKTLVDNAVRRSA